MASFSAAAKAAKAGVRSVNRLPPGGARSSERTASGLLRATSTATPAPNDDPTRWHEVTPRWSRVSSTSPTGSRAPGGRAVGLPEAAQVEAHGIAHGRQAGPLRVPHPAVGDPGVQQHDGGGARRAAALERDAGRCLGRGHGSPGVRVVGAAPPVNAAAAAAASGFRAGYPPEPPAAPLDLAVDEAVGRAASPGPRPPAATRRGRGARGRRPGAPPRPARGRAPGAAASRAIPRPCHGAPTTQASSADPSAGRTVACTYPTAGPVVAEPHHPVVPLLRGSPDPATWRVYRCSRSPRLGGEPPVNAYSPASESTSTSSPAWSTRSGSSRRRPSPSAGVVTGRTPRAPARRRGSARRGRCRAARRGRG